MRIPLDFKPTPMQAGHAIGLAIGAMPHDKLASGCDNQWLLDAGVSRAQFKDELILLSSAAALHAIETAGLTPEIENGAAAGLYEWFREQPSHTSALLLENIEDALDEYAEATKEDMANLPSVSDLSAIEEAFGERLLALGEDNEIRGRACVRLCLVLPKTIWPVQFQAAISMLCDAEFISAQ